MVAEPPGSNDARQAGRRPGRRGPAILALATFVALVAMVRFWDTPGYALRTAEGGYTGDINHYVYWTRLVTLGGIQDAYGGSWPETYAVYPPVTLYGYQVIGTVYRAVVDPAFEVDRAQSSTWLRRGIKSAAMAWHLAAGLAIYAFARRAVGDPRAGLVGALYVANPAALFDVAHWAQPDGAHSLFTVLAVGMLEAGAVAIAGAATALAVLAKPQAAAILPLLVAAGWRNWGGSLIGRAALAGVGSGLVIILPFILSGRLAELLTLPGVISSVMPVASANALNLWWLVLTFRGQEPLFTPDAAPVIAGVSYRLAAGVLVLAQFLFTYWLYWTRRVSLPEAAALGALGWFVFTTQAHENHLFFALPLLALAWPRRPSLLVPYGILTLTIFMNMALHDQTLLEVLGRGLEDPLVRTLRIAIALMNLFTFAGWAIAAGLRRPAMRARDEPRAAVAPPVHALDRATFSAP